MFVNGYIVDNQLVMALLGRAPYGLELLATVDFIKEKEEIEDVDKIFQEIGKWTKRKLMKPFHIKVAYDRLKEYYRQQRL